MTKAGDGSGLFYPVRYLTHSPSVERRNKEPEIKGVIVHIIMHVLLIANAAGLQPFAHEISIAHGAAILALWLSVFFLSFTKEKNDIPSWNFASYTVGAFVTANVVGLIMSGGISLLVFSLHQLFDVDVSWKLSGVLLPDATLSHVAQRRIKT